MKTLTGKDILLRALEPSDLDFLYHLENDESVWELSNTITPYSKFVLKRYLDHAHLDIFEVKQLRLVICEKQTDRRLGFVDLFDFNPKHMRVGLGIIIYSENDRKKGYAEQSLKQICSYANTHLQIHQIYANISEDNHASIRLFEKLGFMKSGIKKDWLRTTHGFKNELIYQWINKA